MAVIYWNGLCQLDGRFVLLPQSDLTLAETK